MYYTLLFPHWTLRSDIHCVPILLAYRMRDLSREINAITVLPSIPISLASFFTEPLLFIQNLCLEILAGFPLDNVIFVIWIQKLIIDLS